MSAATAASFAADDRRDLHRAREFFRQRGGRETLASFRQPLFRQRHKHDHPLVRFARAFADAEDAVLQQHETFDFAVFVENIGDAFRQGKTRNGVWHVCNTAAEHVARDALAVRLVGQREHRGRMGMIDIFVRQEGVEQRLDGRIGRRGIEQIDALVVHHVFVGEAVERAKAPERRELHRRQAGWLDVAHIPA